MKDLCIPVPNFAPEQIAELELTIGGKKIKYHFRVESFPWNVNETKNGQLDSFEKIQRLREAIDNYDDDWELIQIYTPPENAEYIQILFRKRQK